MEVGLYFGTFNPLHNGHMAIVGHMLACSALDAVWLVPSPQSPHKIRETVAPFAERCASIERVLGALQEPRVSLCPVEGALPIPSFTMQTLRALRGEYPQHRFAIIMGSDNVPYLPQWREGQTILRQYPIYVYPRRGHEVPRPFLEMYSNLQLVDAPLLDISSTAIRQGRARGWNMDFYLPIVSER